MCHPKCYFGSKKRCFSIYNMFDKIAYSNTLYILQSITSLPSRSDMSLRQPHSICLTLCSVHCHGQMRSSMLCFWSSVTKWGNLPLYNSLSLPNSLGLIAFVCSKSDPLMVLSVFLSNKLQRADPFTAETAQCAGKHLQAAYNCTRCSSSPEQSHWEDCG